MRTDPYTGLPWYLSERTNLVGLSGRSEKRLAFCDNYEKLIETNPSWWGICGSLYAAVKMLRESNRFDIVVTGVDEYSLFIGILLAKTAQVPVYCVVEDPPFTDRYTPPMSWRYRQEQRVRQFTVRTLLESCSGIFCFIEKDILNKFRLSDVPVYQLMNGVSPQALNWAKGHSTKDKLDSECTIGYVGAISERQGINDLLEIFANALQKVPHLQLQLIGPLENNYAHVYQRRLDNLRLNSNVKLTGWLPYDKMLEKLQECDICVCCNPPSEWFRFAQPLKVCEYLALCKPTISWNYPGVNRLLDFGRLGITVPAGNKSAFADALVSLTDPVLRGSFEKEIHEAIKTQWSSDYWYGQILDVLLKSTE